MSQFLQRLVPRTWKHDLPKTSILCGTGPHHFHLCTLHSAQGTLEVSGPWYVKHRRSVWVIKRANKACVLWERRTPLLLV